MSRDSLTSSAVLPALALLAALVPSPAAQSSLGQDFWLVDSYSSSYGLSIAIANPGPTTAGVTIFNSVLGPAPHAVPPGGVTVLTFASLELGVSGTVISTAPVFHVTSDTEVAVFLFDPLVAVGKNDAALVLSSPALGLRHRIANFVNPVNSGGQVVTVVAVTAGVATSVQILDGAGTVVDGASLVQGEALQRINHLIVGATPADDMTGWEVVADQPVAVFSGSVCTSVGMPAGACDSLVEQLMDADRLALGYAVAPLRTRPLGCTTPPTCAADVFRFVATQDGTTLATTPDVGGGLLDEGDWIQIDTSTPFVITGDKPFFGYQYLASNEAVFGALPPAGVGDPSLLVVLPPEQFQRDYLFHVVPSFPDAFANIVAPEGATLLLDGVPISEPCEPIGVVADASYCSVRLPLTSGNHRIHSPDSDFGLTITGFGDYASYAYPAGLGRACDEGVDGWMKDGPTDDGSEPDTSVLDFWESGDLWIRNEPDPDLLHQHEHQNPIGGVVNYLYVKLRNRGCAPLVSGELVTYYAAASTGLVWPASWFVGAPGGDMIGSEPVAFVASNGEIVLEFEWTPPAIQHYCLLARFVAPEDPMSFVEGSSVPANAKNNNNIAWKNVTVVDEQGGAGYEFTARNIQIAESLHDFVFKGAPQPPATSGPVAVAPFGTVRVRLTPAMFADWRAGGGQSKGLVQVPGKPVFLVVSPVAELLGVRMAAGEEHLVQLQFSFLGGPAPPPGPFVVTQLSHMPPGVAEVDGGVTYVFR